VTGIFSWSLRVDCWPPERAPAGHRMAQPDPGSARSRRAGYPRLIAGLRCHSRLAVDAGICRDPGPGRSRARSSHICRRWTTGLHPAQCWAELTPSSGGQSLPACCGARLDQAGHGRQASAALIDLQVKILDLLCPDGPASTLSAGQPAPPNRYFADLRALGLLACSTWPAARSLSPDEDAASAIDEHVAMVEREAARQQRTSSSAARAGFDIPPIDAAASGGLTHIADRILAGCPDEVRERLRSRGWRLARLQVSASPELTAPRQSVLGDPRKPAPPARPAAGLRRTQPRGGEMSNRYSGGRRGP